MNKNIEEELMKLASSEQQGVAPERDRRVEKLENSDRTLKLAMRFAKAMNSVEGGDFKDIELALNKVFAVGEMNILKDYDGVLSKYGPGFIKPTVLERIEKSIQNKKPGQVIVCQGEDNLIFLPDGVLYFVGVKKYPEAMISQVLTLGLGNIRYVADNIERDANFDETTGLGLDV